MKNPPWSTDELIVTLDFYIRHSPNIPQKTSEEIKSLSNFLNKLQVKTGVIGNKTFRNNNGVYMKLMNFKRLDPNYHGKGLERGSKGDEQVWNRYSSDLNELDKISKKIRLFVDSDISLTTREEDLEEEGEEGRVLTVIHKKHERDPKLVRNKKRKVLQEKGYLSCEICEFDFSKVYGDRGDGFIECHHNLPVSELEPGMKTKLSDLSLVCSNCHRIIHRKKPWFTLRQLREIYNP